MSQAARALVVCLYFCGGRALAQERVGAVPYEKLATREASEERVMQLLRPQGEEWGEWWMLAPFAYKGHGSNDLASFREPQNELARMSAGGPGPDLSKTYAGKKDTTAAWKKLGRVAGERIDLRVFDDEALNNNVCGFLYTTVSTAAAHTAEVDMGSDDGLRLWLNGKLLVDRDVPRSLDPHADHVRLDLAAGHNHVLLEIAQGGGGWEYQMLASQPLDPREDCQLQYYLDRDFPPSREREHWRALTIPVPEDIVLEVGGLSFFSDGRPVVCTRRGDVFAVANAYAEPPVDARFDLFAGGLHEPLGCAVRSENGRDVVYCVQRGELTRLVDLDRDGRADRYECASDNWGVSGNYHEFAFGPKFDAAGNAWVTLNVAFCGGLGKSIVPWRGWALKVSPAGELTPVCDGLRSPNGIGQWSDGEWFYVDNQGDYVATNRLSHLGAGTWHGHPASLRWRTDLKTPEARPPREPAAVFFPYKKMGQSTADLALDTSGGRFGPFTGQFITGDQTLATLERADLEFVEGQYQGACFPLLSGLDCGVNRVAFALDGSLFVGQTDRGWGSVGRKRYGLQRVVYTGKPAFELLHVRVRADGFELDCTQDLDPVSASNAASYAITSFSYEYHADYGAPEIEEQRLKVGAASLVSPRVVRLAVEPLREGYVHEISAAGLRSAAGEPLLHDTAWYTLQRVPGRPVPITRQPEASGAKKESKPKPGRETEGD